ncbi:MAG: SDR family NAD(P)-dependent oxidoreductase [Alphaproteobacteria bacterium]
MKIKGATALVTGANRGLGQRFVEALVEFSAAKIYATARNIDTLDPLVGKHGGLVVPLGLDVTEQAQVDAVAGAARDVTLLLNNAGVLDGRSLMEAESLSGFEHEMAVNVYGLARMCQAFAPIIEANGGGAIANMLSVACLVHWPPFGTYAATKAAAMSLTATLQFDLRDRGVEVFGIYAGFIDTEMAGFAAVDKSSPEEVARNTMLGIEAGGSNIDATEGAIESRTGLQNDPEGLKADVWLRAAEFRASHPLT